MRLFRLQWRRQFRTPVQLFENPFIKHELASIALNSISKYKVRVLPSALKYIELKKALPERLLYSLAALIRFYKGTWKSQALPVNDTTELMAFFGEVWLLGDKKEITKRVLANTDFWDIDLNKLPGVTDYVADSLNNLESSDLK